MTQTNLDFTPRNGTAIMSPDDVYRYCLSRERLLSNSRKPRTALVCGLNPSTATATEDDPTIRKTVEFAKRWQCDRLVMINAYAYRATDPSDMLGARDRGVDIVGPENDKYIAMSIEACEDDYDGIIVVAWGANVDPARQVELARVFARSRIRPQCLGINKGGTPKHPLYLSYETPLQTWSCP